MGYLYRKLKPFREWQETLPLWKRILVELIGIIVITAPFSALLWYFTGDTYYFFPVAK